MTVYQTTWDAGRYTPAYLRIAPLEAHVQHAVLQRLRYYGALAFPVDAGAKLLRGRAIGALRRAGVARADAVVRGRTGAGIAGLADVMFVWTDGRAGFLEVKRPHPRNPGRPNANQLAFLADAHAHGAITGVVWAAHDVETVLRQNGVVIP